MIPKWSDSYLKCVLSPFSIIVRRLMQKTLQHRKWVILTNGTSAENASKATDRLNAMPPEKTKPMLFVDLRTVPSRVHAPLLKLPSKVDAFPKCARVRQQKKTNEPACASALLLHVLRDRSFRISSRPPDAFLTS